jgi:tRNA (guanine-N7-)-methyltransferase
MQEQVSIATANQKNKEHAHRNHCANPRAPQQRFKRCHIRSFVHRARQLTPYNQGIVDTLGRKYLLQLDDGILKTPLLAACRTATTTTAGTILEIGCGMGDLIFNAAMAFPEYDFIGIEVHRPGVANLLKKIQAAATTEKIKKVDNIRIYQDDALEVLRRCIPNGSLQQVLLFFPDPWPKKRHHKRRIVRPEFMQLVYDKLAPQGIFHMATDCEDYAQQSRELIAQTQFHTAPLPSLLQHEDEATHRLHAFITDQLRQTKFARRALKAGSNIWKITALKD